MALDLCQPFGSLFRVLVHDGGGLGKAAIMGGDYLG